MKLAILIHTGPGGVGMTSSIGIAKAALGKGHEVNIFIMAEAVSLLANAEFVGLIGEGAKVSVCEHNRNEHKAPEGVEGVDYASQYDFAILAQECDKVISFT